jgi:uncharacterized protein (TIGR03663 family)
MKWQKSYPYLIAGLLLLSAFLRILSLEMRPMHGDEAVNAVKFGTLLEHGTYTYDPIEYHGPTLYFFSLISALPQAQTSFPDLNEFSLRIIPALFGLLLMAVFLFIKKDLDQQVLLLTLLFLAISPANVFYNRYYIHESLLVFFSVGMLGSAYLYLKNKKIITLILSGLFLGLMISTKETWVIYAAALFIALICTIGIKKTIVSIKGKTLLLFGTSCLLVCLLFYSSFFQNPAGIPDALISYQNYFSRAATNQVHVHAWDYYLSLLLFFKNSPSHFWTEGLLVIFSMVSLLIILRDKKSPDKEKTVLRFMAVYTLCLIVLFSSIPYKTPWNMLGFLPGMALLAAYAIVGIYRLIRRRSVRIVYSSLLVIGLLHLLWESVQLNFVYPSNPSNPYVYAHPLPDVFEIERRVREITNHHPQGKNLHIQVMAENSDYWPLPWYFRKYTKVGWWSAMPPAETLAPLIILNAGLESDLVQRLYVDRPPGQRNLYVPLFDHEIFLRPGIEFRAYIKKDDWDLAHSPDNDVFLK